MKLVPIFIFAFYLMAVNAQSGTTLKPTTAKQSTSKTSPKPKLTTFKSTLKTTVTTAKTFKPSAYSMTTTKPVTTTPSTTNSFKICRDINSTATNGSIQPLDGLTPGPWAAIFPRICVFTIVAPTDQRIQMSCSVANLTKTITFSTGSGITYSSCLNLSGTIELFFLLNVIVPIRIYTSYNNTMTVTYRVVNASDTFNCQWQTIKAQTTSTDFQWNYIQPLYELFVSPINQMGAIIRTYGIQTLVSVD